MYTLKSILILLSILTVIGNASAKNLYWADGDTDKIQRSNNSGDSQPVIISVDPNTNLDEITIASFNIQTFGVTKASKPDVMATLAQIISNFDIVAIQEIKDISETAIEVLENDVDALGVDYDYILGPRLGSTSYKEQYAFMYRTDSITYESSYTYDDSVDDEFFREPLIARFKTNDGNFEFVLVNFHAAPDEATAENDSLDAFKTHA